MLRSYFLWSLAVTALLFFLYLIVEFVPNISAFIISFLLAYILHPAVERMMRWNFSKIMAIAVVYVLFMGIIALFLTWAVPIIYKQISALIIKIPEYRAYIKQDFMPFLKLKLSAADPFIADKILGSVKDLMEDILQVIADMFYNLWEYTVATISFAITISLVPILLLYFLKDWNLIINNMKNILPRKKTSVFVKIISEINDLIFAYIAGQMSVCLLFSLFYSVGLYMVGLEFALLLGFISGFLSIIPFIGALISFISAMVLTSFAFGIFSSEFFYVFFLYIAGNFIENYIIVPKIIGGKIGLHPFWIIFAVFASAAAFGFLGILLAIPIAGIIKILASHSISRYKRSDFYKN